ncbi:MAG: sulfotransferase [Rhodococcus sp. (in: high G+C Gram-positive bacteria)]
MATTERTSVGTIDDLHASATKLCGLDDFGDSSADNYLEGLEVLLDSYHREAGLTPMGRSIKRAFLRGALVARALSEQGWKDNPHYADVQIERPIFVTGLPRTGTTALHRLLTADPAHQGLELWLTEVPQPRPPRETWVQNPVFQGIEAGYRRHHIDNPEFMGLHYMSADDVEECWQLLRQSITSISYESLALVPSYSRWLQAQNWAAAYARHKRNLQLIGLPDAEKRWVLKNPSHLFALDELFEIYPDALVIQTHRDPATAMASVCSLNAQATVGWSTAFVGGAIGRSQLDLWSRGLSTFTQARRGRRSEQIVDVDYSAFVSDPIGTVASIYDRIGIDFTDAARAAMTTMNQAGRSGDRRPAHRYSLADFGLTHRDIEARFPHGTTGTGSTDAAD